MSKTTYHSLGVRLDIESVLDGHETVVAAWQTDREGLYRLLVDDVLRGFLELTEDGWFAKAIGDERGQELGYRDPADIDLASRAAAEDFLGRTLR